VRTRDTGRNRKPATTRRQTARGATSPAALGNQALARLAASDARPELGRVLQAGNAATAAVVARTRGKGGTAETGEKKRGGTTEKSEKKEPKWKPKTKGDEAPPELSVPKGYEKFLAPAGSVYVRSKHPPEKVFNEGFRRREGYDDIVKHATVDQGFGSNWIATAKSPWIQENYGAYLYEIQHDGTRAIDVNTAYETLEKHRNPHAEQNEVAIYRRVPPEWLVAVWETRAETLDVGEATGDESNYFFPLFTASYARKTRAEALGT
jgi:hypothetical protein